jgi:serralysin
MVAEGGAYDSGAYTGGGSGEGSQIYVDGVNGLDGNPGTEAAPFKTVDKGWSVATAGATIHLLPTTTYGPLYFASKSGAHGAPITLQGDGTGSNLTKLSGQGTNFAILIDTGASYIVVRDFDMTAPPGADADEWSCAVTQNNDHVVFSNNYVHDCAGYGIGSYASDYVTFTGNIVTGNSWDNFHNYYSSALSMLENVNSDSNTGLKMYVADNVIFNNYLASVPAGCSGADSCLDSDGEGIIIDSSRRQDLDQVAYTGATLIENNVVYANGSDGVEVFQSDHVTIRNNTLYENCGRASYAAWHPGEIYLSIAGDVSVYNNVLYADGSAGNAASSNHTSISVENCNGEPITVAHNLAYNATANAALGYQYNFQSNTNTVTLTDLRWGDPLFVAPATTASANFDIKSGSAALAFQSASSTFPPVDILGDPRSAPVTAGAYEAPGE